MFDLVGLLIIFLMGFVPMIFWTALLWWVDHWEREPWYLIVAAFVWGAVPSIILALLLNYFLLLHLFSINVFYEQTAFTILAVVVAPITEESMKALALLLLFVFQRREIDSLLDGLIYGAAVGFGFAAVENIFYFLGAAAGPHPLELIWTMIVRTFVFGTNHATFTALTGLGFAFARFQTKWYAWLGFPLAGLLLAIVLHGLHNFLVGFGIGIAVGVHAIMLLSFMALIITSLIIQRHWVRNFLATEVKSGVLTQLQADVASSAFRSWRLDSEHRQLKKLSVELAMKKHACERVGGKGKSVNQIEALRQRVYELSTQLRR